MRRSPRGGHGGCRTRRRRRRPEDDPGPPRPQLAVDDAAVQPRRRPTAAPRVRPRASSLLIVTSAARDAEVEGFLALLATNRAPRTVDAYRRDLAALAA